MVSKRLAPVDVRKMYLDHGQLGGAQRVQDGDRGVRVGARVDDDSVGGLARLLDPVDELTLVIRLPELDGETEGGGMLQARLLDVSEGLPPIGCRLAHA